MNVETTKHAKGAKVEQHLQHFFFAILACFVV